MSTLRIASIGTGIIVDWFLASVADVEGLDYVGAFSRTIEKARSWGEPRGAKLFFDSLDELAACPDIDAVYIASPNALHIPYAKKMLAAGKHVLAEKPLASNAREAAEAFAIAREHGVVLMEAMRNVHTAGFATVEATLPCLGDITSATLRFSKVSSRVPALKAGKLTNTFDPRMAGGAIMDIGVYCVAPMVALWGKPRHVCAMGTTFDVGTIGGDPAYPLVELAGEALCDYGSFAVNLSWGKVSDNHLLSQIQGTEATLLIDSIAEPERLLLVTPVQSEGYGSGEGETTQLDVTVERGQLTEELRDFVRFCQEGDRADGIRHYEQVSLDMLEVIDEIRAQLGVRYPADEA